METVAKEPPDCPTVEAGLSAIDVGGCCAVNVTCDCALTPFQVAVSVAVVFAVTVLVGMASEAEALPGATLATAGGCTAGESLERFTTAPPAGARPFSMTIASGWAPPLMVPGAMMSEFSDGGSRVNCTAADAEFRVAVSVTTVGEVTCPVVIWNCVQAVLPGIATVAGTGAAAEFELERLTVAPVAATAEVSCTATQEVLPLYSGLLTTVTDTGVGGAEGMVNDRAAENAVSADVVGELSPCAERTRQNFVPDVSDSTAREGPLSCGSSSSIDANPASRAICNSYPLGCGLGTSAQVSVTGSVSAVPVAGDDNTGAGPMGLLKKTENVMTFDGTPAMPFEFTAMTRAK